jgi:hypothetical protein
VKIGISRKITVHVAIKVPRDFRLEAKILAEDMGLEEVRIVQTLKFQGGKAPSTLVPGIVPTLLKFFFPTSNAH